MNIDQLLYGTSKLEHIVACDYDVDNRLKIWLETPGQPVTEKTFNVPRWLVSKTERPGWFELKGTLPYRWMKTFSTSREYWDTRRAGNRDEFLGVYDEREIALVIGGFTQFKGMEPKDVSVLAFDIEATGIEHGPEAKTLIISNTYRRGPNVERRMFTYDEYPSQGEMIRAWCDWVREVNPSLIIGHNIYTYDLPYLAHCALKDGYRMLLGRDGSEVQFNKYESKFRRDGSQFYPYNGVRIFGRQIIDTFFLSIKYDVARKYDSYGLKSIIAAEGLEVQGRQHYDASLIRKNYTVAQEWGKIKRYAEHDADDSLALYDLMIPAFFYLARMIPKSFQQLLTGASGAQINSLLVRSYLQAGHSIPAPSDPEPFEGAISIGNPGVYSDVFKVDVASLYPSIMLEYEVSDKEKDPLGHTLLMLKSLTDERLTNKRLAKETGRRSYKDLEGGQKIIINSIYGLLGAPGINFNSPKNASLVTSRGRGILQQAISWAEKDNYKIVNADTDSISITDGTPWDEVSRRAFIAELNSDFPKQIRWEDDGTYSRVLVLKAKNYVLDTPEKRTIKGSALKATMKEPALREFIEETINALICDCPEDVATAYYMKVREILNLSDIKRWAHKKTITESVLSPSRTNEQKVLDAIDVSEVTQGDKLYLYFRADDTLAVVDEWKGDHSIKRLLEKLYRTLQIFAPVYPVKELPNFALKRNQRLLLANSINNT